MTVSERIRGERHRYGLTQKELAALIGVDTKTVIRWEAGRSRPTDRHLLRLVRVLGVSLDDVTST